jgi:hypothetical protein
VGAVRGHSPGALKPHSGSPQPQLGFRVFRQASGVVAKNIFIFLKNSVALKMYGSANFIFIKILISIL